VGHHVPGLELLTNDNSDTKTTVTIGLLSASAFYFGPMILTWNRPISNA
jgi:hypothetical protein